jgi:cysteine-rich repeat protein
LLAALLAAAGCSGSSPAMREATGGTTAVDAAGTGGTTVPVDAGKSDGAAERPADAGTHDAGIGGTGSGGLTGSAGGAGGGDHDGGAGGAGSGGTAGNGIDAGRDGAAGNGAAGSGGAQGTGGSGGSGGSPSMVGQACGSPGALACDGPNQKLSLICNPNRWRANQTCGVSQNCDSSSGVCADILPECVNNPPGFATCMNDVLHQCGPDRVTATDVACVGVCRNGACLAPACGDGKVEAGESCDDGNTTSADGCENDCKPSSIVALSAGVSHTCALLAEGFVRCWGANDVGQLGLATTADLSGQAPYMNGVVKLGAPAAAIAVGANHTCALMTDATVRCWGANASGQLGLGHTMTIGDDEAPDAATATVPLGASVQAIAAGGDVTCALITDGTLRCWGQNGFGQLGLGHTRNIGDDETPTRALAEPTLDDRVTSVATGGDHTCAVMAGGPVRCWGRNDLGQLGIGNNTEIGDNEPPTAVPAILATYGPFSKIVAGRTRAFALTTSQQGVHAWGDDTDGGLGIGFIQDLSTTPADNWGNFTFDVATLDVSAGGYHACVRLYNQAMRCWGTSAKGQLGRSDNRTIGDNEAVSMITPIDLGVDTAGSPRYAVAMATGALHTCALLNTGVLLCWGENGAGQLGLGYRSLPPGLDYVGGTPDTIPAKLAAVQVFPPSH